MPLTAEEAAFAEIADWGAGRGLVGLGRCNEVRSGLPPRRAVIDRS